MFSVVNTRSFNCPRILFHRLIGETLLFLWNTIFPLKNGKICGRDNADLEEGLNGVVAFTVIGENFGSFTAIG